MQMPISACICTRSTVGILKMPDQQENTDKFYRWSKLEESKSNFVVSSVPADGQGDKTSAGAGMIKVRFSTGIYRNGSGKVNIISHRNIPIEGINHCSLVTPYGDIDPDQYWLR